MTFRSRDYLFEVPGRGASNFFYEWHDELPDEMAPRVLDLMRAVSEDTPIIGFGRKITDEAFASYWEEMKDNLAAEKVRLMTMNHEEAGIIGLCNFRRNLNPNNSHIADLAKGMIDPPFRGRGVLPAAFVEICGQCVRDGVETVTLDVRDESEAEKIWTRFGFTTYGVLPDYSRAEGRSYRGYFMYQPVAELLDLSQRLVAKYEVED